MPDYICIGGLIIFTLAVITLFTMYRRLLGRIENIQYGKMVKATYENIASLKKQPRKRYIVVEYVGDDRSDLGNPRQAIKNLEELLRTLLGEIGLANSGVTVIEYNHRTRRFIIRTYHHKVDEVLGAIGIINTRGRAKFAVITITGSVRKARKSL